MASFIPIQFIGNPYSRPAYVTYSQPSYQYVRSSPFGFEDEYGYDDAVSDLYTCQRAYEAALRRAYQERLLADQRRQRLAQRHIEQQSQQQQLAAALHDFFSAYQDEQQSRQRQQQQQREQSPQPQPALLKESPSSPVKSPQPPTQSPVQSKRPSTATPTRRPAPARSTPRVIPIAGWDDNTTQTTNNTNTQSSSATPAPSSSTAQSPSPSQPTLLTVPAIQTTNLPESSTTAPHSSSSSPVIIEDVPTTPDEDAKEDAVRYEQRIQHTN